MFSQPLGHLCRMNIEIQNLAEEQTQPEVGVVALPQKNLELISAITDAVRAITHQGAHYDTPQLPPNQCARLRYHRQRNCHPR